MNTKQIVEQAFKIVERHNLAAEMDAGFDAGEWSGPAHDAMEMDALADLANQHGLTFDQLDTMMMEYCPQYDPTMKTEPDLERF
jgi:hypothetical protein